MTNEQLSHFLIDDVKALVAYINEHEDIQDIKTTGTEFDSLGEFASYWSHHISKLDY